MGNRVAWLLLLLQCLVLCGHMGTVQAQSTWGEEYARRLRSAEIVEPLRDDALGDQISVFDGSVQFRVTDISLPGNNALPVELVRLFNPRDVTYVHHLGNWQLDIPRISSVMPSNHTQGWQADPPVVWSNGSLDFERDWYWSGHRLHVPQGGGDLLTIPASDSKRVKPNLGVPLDFGTKDNWYFSILPSIPGSPGQGLIGYAPDGTKYTFNKLIDFQYGPIQHPYISVYRPDSPILNRVNRFLFVTRIEDRFGNWVSYDWEGSNLKRIH